MVVTSARTISANYWSGYGSVSRKQAEAKAVAEYEKFNKQQRIESDFDRTVKKLLQRKDAEE